MLVFTSGFLNSNIDTMRMCVNTTNPVSVVCVPKSPTGNNNAISVDPWKRFR